MLELHRTAPEGAGYHGVEKPFPILPGNLENLQIKRVFFDRLVNPAPDSDGATIFQATVANDGMFRKDSRQGFLVASVQALREAGE